MAESRRMVEAKATVIERADPVNYAKGYPIKIKIHDFEQNTIVLMGGTGVLSAIYMPAEEFFKHWPNTAATLKDKDVCEISFYSYNQSISLLDKGSLLWYQ